MMIFVPKILVKTRAPSNLAPAIRVQKKSKKEYSEYGITKAPNKAMASPVAPWPLSLGINMPFNTSVAGGFT